MARILPERGDARARRPAVPRGYGSGVTESHFLAELLLALAIAAVGVALFERVRLPPIAGFLLMGALLGPGGLALAPRSAEVRRLAEFGVVFLLFEIGLELPFEALRRRWRTTVAAGGLQVALTIGAVSVGAIALGLRPASAVVMGGLVAMSSTALVMRLLSEAGEADAPHGQLSFGVLIFQDLCIVPLLVALPMLSGAVPPQPGAIALALGKAAAALSVLFVATGYAVPWALDRLVRVRSRELFSLIAFLLAVGSAVGAEEMGLTLAVGAFSAGVMLGSSPYAHQLTAELVPLRGVLLGATLLADPWFADLLAEVSSEWVSVPEGPEAGRSIGELAVRTRTGASILAVESAEGTQVNPAPERELAAGDRVLAIGSTEALAKLRALLGGAP